MLGFLAAAAALWSPLNISLIIKAFFFIFGPYVPWQWENFSTCLNLTSDLYQGHMIKNNFFGYTRSSSRFSQNYSQQGAVIWHMHSQYQKLELIRFWEKSVKN